MTDIIFEDISIPESLHIFILEDTEVFQKKLQTDLRKMGFTGKITLTVTVKEALVNFAKEKPDFILSDWNLPDGTGINFLNMVREDEHYHDVPFVMITTVDEIDSILTAVENGADGYIVKPWDIKELKEKIAFAYSKKKKSLNL